MHQYIERLRYASWTYRQPLTLRPIDSGAPVSDLFAWRNSKDWETFFELINMPALFEDESKALPVSLKFFDASGREFREYKVDTPVSRRTTLALSELIGEEHGEYGTFCVFHSHTPEAVRALGAHLAERGYVSYRYGGAPLKGYVHGNFDAIARLGDGALQMLGGSSLRPREYRLQHLLTTSGAYELVLVNATAKKQDIECRILTAGGVMAGSEVVSLPPRGNHIFIIESRFAQHRIVISSHIAMARPLIFRIQNQRMDVFHG